jgi:hypothetical protein
MATIGEVYKGPPETYAAEDVVDVFGFVLKNQVYDFVNMTDGELDPTLANDYLSLCPGAPAVPTDYGDWNGDGTADDPVPMIYIYYENPDSASPAIHASGDSYNAGGLSIPYSNLYSQQIPTVGDGRTPGIGDNPLAWYLLEE